MMLSTNKTKNSRNAARKEQEKLEAILGYVKMNSKHPVVVMLDTWVTGSHDHKEHLESDQDLNDTENLTAGHSAFFQGELWPLYHRENESIVIRGLHSS